MKPIAIAYTLLACVCLAAAVGWCMNIAAIIHTGFAISQWGGMQVARVAGIFIVPLGGLLGYF